jgi:hypothetical protein
MMIVKPFQGFSFVHFVSPAPLSFAGFVFNIFIPG